MTLDQGTSLLVIPEASRRRRRPWWIAALTVSVLGICWGLSGVSFRQVRSRPSLKTVEVDRGDVALVVTENGSVEGADDTVVRCRVESFLALPPGAAATPPTRGGPPGARPAPVRVPGSLGPALPGTGSPTTPGRGQTKGPSKAKAVGAGVASKLRANSSAFGPSPAGAPSSSSRAAAPESDSLLKRPDIVSFDYIVEPHVPLRTGATDPIPVAGPPPQPPTILSILPEGTRVKAGDVVCELDSSAFRDELRAQQIRCARAKAWVAQARSILEVNEIALREYERGVFPQDIELIRQYIAACHTELERAGRNLAWSRDVAAKGLRTQAQARADALSHRQAEVALEEAEGMLERLTKYTGTRIIKARKAKIEAVRADMLSLEISAQREDERLKRIEAMIAHCTMRAPRDGVVAYANRSNVWGHVEMQIREGLTVHQSQPIFTLPDPKHMHVKAKINESLVAQIRSGLPALIRVDAFPDHPLRGRVAEITPVPAPASGPISDVRAYFATVQIESGGFGALRAGLSAEVDFQVETRRQVTRVPLEAIRWVGNQTFSAIAFGDLDTPSWRWRRVALGVSDTTFAEVVSGLKPGDRVIAHPESLPAPRRG